MSRRRPATTRPPRALAALLAAAAALACLTGPRSASPEAPRPLQLQRPPEATDLGEALQRALADPAERRRLRLFAEGEQPDGFRTVEVFGRGIGIWDGRRQFQATAAEIETAIRAAVELGFSSMAPIYGAGNDAGRPAPEPAGGGPLRLLGAVEIRVGEEFWRAEQLARGERHRPLLQLVSRLLQLWRAAGEAGRAAADLEDGLTRIGAGGLAPETLRLAAHDKPELGSPGEGYLLRLDGGRLTVLAVSGDGGYGPPRVSAPAAAKLRALAAELARLAPGRLPGNLFSPRYVDLTLEVLGHRHSIQARRFAGLTATTHGAAQRRFDSLLGAVRELAAQRPGGSDAGGAEGAGA